MDTARPANRARHVAAIRATPHFGRMARMQPHCALWLVGASHWRQHVSRTGMRAAPAPRARTAQSEHATWPLLPCPLPTRGVTEFCCSQCTRMGRRPARLGNQPVSPISPEKMLFPLFLCAESVFDICLTRNALDTPKICVFLPPTTRSSHTGIRVTTRGMKPGEWKKPRVMKGCGKRMLGCICSYLGCEQS